MGSIANLPTDYGTEPPVNPYLDDGIEDGWIRIAIPLVGNRDDTFESVTNPVEQAQHLTDESLNQRSKCPITNNWQDEMIENRSWLIWAN